MKKTLKYVFAFIITATIISIISMISTSAHSLVPWAGLYSMDNVNNNYQFALFNCSHMEGDTVYYHWESENLRNEFSDAFENGVSKWDGLIKAKEKNPSDAYMLIARYDENIHPIKHNFEEEFIEDTFAYVWPYGPNTHARKGQDDIEMILVDVDRLYDFERAKVFAHELGHVWGIGDLYREYDNLESNYSSDYGYFTRHDKNAMYICLNNPWFKEANGNTKYQKTPVLSGGTWQRQWTVNEWKTIDNKEYYFDNNGKMATGFQYKTKPGTGSSYWYYFEPSYSHYVNYEEKLYGRNGHLVKNGWVQDGDYWYYIDGNGRLETGQTRTGSQTVYDGITLFMTADSNSFQSSGYTVLTRWQKNNTNGLWYFHNTDGSIDTTNDHTDWDYLHFNSVNEARFCYFTQASSSSSAGGYNITVGWKKIGDLWYYFDAEGKFDNPNNEYTNGGLQYTGTDYYYFTLIENGYMGGSLTRHGYAPKTGWQSENGLYYYFEPSGTNAGKLKTGNSMAGLNQVNDYFYRFMLPSGTSPSGGYSAGMNWRKQGSIWYFMTPGYNGIEPGQNRTGMQEISGTYYYLAAAASNPSGGYTQLSGWQNHDNYWYYMYSNGGFEASAGYTRTGKQQINNAYYFLGPPNSTPTLFGGYEMYTGWMNVNNKWSYFYPGSGSNFGKAVTGLVTITENNVSKKYYFDDNHEMSEKWVYTDGIYRYFEPSSGTSASGRKGYMLKGDFFYAFNDNTGTSKDWYYFEASANSKNDGRMLTGWQVLNDEMYYFNSSGNLLTGWQSITKNGTTSWFYSPASTSSAHNGAIKKGWQTISSNQYYFKESGASSGAMSTGLNEINNEYYYFEPTSGNTRNGYMRTGFITISGTNDIYYFNTSDGKSERNGWFYNSNGNWYYAGGDGKLFVGWQYFNGCDYYFHADGKISSGWQYLSKNGTNSSWYYSNPSTSSVRKGEIHRGWLDLSNERYYFNSSGVLLSGWQTLTTSGVSSKYYFVPATVSSHNGHMKKGLHTIDGYKYYFKENANDVGKMASGVTKVGSYWYYFNTADGRAQLNTGPYYAENFYYISDSEGRMVSGQYKYNTSNITFSPPVTRTVNNQEHIYNTQIIANTNGSITCKAFMKGAEGMTTGVTISISLLKYENGSWVGVPGASWTSSTNGKDAYHEGTIDNMPAGQYRTVTYFSLQNNGTSYSGFTYEPSSVNHKCKTGLTIDSNGMAKISVEYDGAPGSTIFIVASAKLQRTNNGTWSDVPNASWSIYTSSPGYGYYSLSANEYFLVTSGYSYRVVVNYYEYLHDMSNFTMITDFSGWVSY